MGRVILLGVGTAVPDVDRGHTHMVWDGEDGALLVDAGGDTYQRLLKAGIDPQKLAGIILTHSHADHINGLPALLFSMSLAGRRAVLPIYGLPETLELSQQLVAACALEEHVATVDWRVLPAGEALRLADGRVVQTALNNHSRPCLALRFTEPTGGQAITYSGDTAPCEAVIELARGAHTLIHEATVDVPGGGHTTPRQAAEVAVQAGVQRLVLVHYSPRWTLPENLALQEVQAGGFTGKAEIGREYQILEPA